VVDKAISLFSVVDAEIILVGVLMATDFDSIVTRGEPKPETLSSGL